MTSKPAAESGGASTPANSGVHAAGAHASPDVEDAQRSRVADLTSARLRAFGVHLAGTESLEDLGNLLEAVERFEEVVERRGGDLMVDEPINGIEPIAPDVAAFLLPVRSKGESVSSFVARIDSAASEVRGMRARP